MSKHTPGPWTYGTRKDGTMWMSLGDYMTGQHFQFNWMAGEANARLITTAPDGLARAKANVEAFEAINAVTPWRDSEPAWWVAWSEQARLDRAYIAKAEGSAGV